MRDHGELMAEAAADGFESPAQAAEARRLARQDAAEVAAELAAEYAEQVGFFIASVPEKRWRELFKKKPTMSNPQIAAIIGCSDVSVRTMRNRLGFPPYPTGGFHC